VSIGDTDFGVQVSIGVVGRVVAALVAFLGSIVLARVLGPDGYGTFYLLMAVVAFLDNPITGWANACRKRLTEEDFPSGGTIGSMFISIVLTSAAVFLLSWLLSPSSRSSPDTSTDGYCSPPSSSAWSLIARPSRC